MDLVIDDGGVSGVDILIRDGARMNTMALAMAESTGLRVRV